MLLDFLRNVLGNFCKFKELTVDSQRWLNHGINYDRQHALRPYTWVSLNSTITADIEKDNLDCEVSDAEGSQSPPSSHHGSLLLVPPPSLHREPQQRWNTE